MFSLCGCQTPAQYWIKILHPWVQDWAPPGLAQSAPGPFGPGTPIESEKSLKGCPWASGPRGRVQPGVRKESKNAASDSFWTLFGLRGALFGDSGAPRGRRPGAPFRTLLGFRAQRAREQSVPGREVPKSMNFIPSIGVGVRRKADEAFSDSNTSLDTLQSSRSSAQAINISSATKSNETVLGDKCYTLLGGSQTSPKLLADWKLPGLPRSSPATSPELLSLWVLRAIQRIPRSSQTPPRPLQK